MANKKNALILFSGTNSFGKVLEEMGWNVYTLDNRKSCRSTYCEDILLWNYKALFKPGFFDFIQSSPNCKNFSKGNTYATQEGIEAGCELVKKSLEIIEFFKPRGGYCLENPRSGTLKNQPFMASLPFFDVCYCAYGTDYRKETRLWSDLPSNYFTGKVCGRGGICESMFYNEPTRRWRHLTDVEKLSTYDQRIHIPRPLVQDFCKGVEEYLDRA
jgi:hypothetical protein